MTRPLSGLPFSFTDFTYAFSFESPLTTVTLKDAEPPEGAAFYRVVVSVWCRRDAFKMSPL